MWRKIIGSIVILSCVLVISYTKNVYTDDLEGLEKRLDYLETKIAETNYVTDKDLHEALQKKLPVYAEEPHVSRIKFGGRVDGFVQYLTSTSQDELGVVGRLWFDARAKIIPDKLDFLVEFNSAGGKSIGAGLPTNEITIDRSAFNDLGRGNVNIYKAHSIWKPIKGLQIATGVMDWLNHEDPVGVSGDVGFDNSDVTICEGWSFPSLSVGAWLGLVSELKADAPSVPALALRYDPNDMWTFRTSIQTTQTSSMFTTRNDFGNTDLFSWTSEIAFRPKIFDRQGAYKIFYGLTRSGDSSPSDTATGARLNPSGVNHGVGFLFDQWLSDHFIINARYSVSEDDDIFKSSNNGVRSHWNATIGWISDGNTYSAREFVGVGYGSARWGSSYEREFGTNEREKTIDVFWRHKINDHLWVAPDLQVVIDPLRNNDATEIIPGIQMWATF